MPMLANVLSTTPVHFPRNVSDGCYDMFFRTAIPEASLHTPQLFVPTTCVSALPCSSRHLARCQLTPSVPVQPVASGRPYSTPPMSRATTRLPASPPPSSPCSPPGLVLHSACVLLQ